MTPSRLRGIELVALLVANGLALLAWSQAWVQLTVDGHPLEVSGQSAGDAVLALALTGLVLVAALALAGVVFRVVLGVLQALLGLCVGIAAGMALADPVAASAAAISTATGLTGTGADQTVTASAFTAWPVVALVAGVLLALLGVVVALSARRWPASTRRFQRSRMESPGGGTVRTPTTPLEEWDALSDGDDPTADPR